MFRLARTVHRPLPPADLEPEQMLGYVRRHFGFEPGTVSPTATRYGVIDRGPRRGFLVVFTEDVHVDEHATRKSNFVDADRAYSPYCDDPAYLAYIFAPLCETRRAAA